MRQVLSALPDRCRIAASGRAEREADAMGKILGILAIVLGVWIGAEVLTEGVDHAFGGIFVKLGMSTSSGERIDPDTVPVRAAERYRRGFDRGIERVEKALDEK
jgi:hypothetical protein